MPALDIESKLEEYSRLIANAIFSGDSKVEIAGTDIPIKEFKSKGLKYVDFYGFRFIEQNPNKSSRWARMAREGKNVLWVFRGRSYYARVINGTFTRLKR